MARYETLVISGGSTKGVGLLGSLYYLNDTFKLSRFTNFYATSVGSIIVVLLALGFKPEELFLYFTQFKFIPRLDFSKNNIQFLDFGLFKKFIEELIISRFEQIPTLGDIENLGKSLHLVSYNYSQNRMEVLSGKTHADMPCSTAFSLSCALPVIFGLKTPETCYKGDYFYDGGFVCNFPLNLAVKDGARDILAINIRSPETQSSADLVPSILLNLMFVSIQKQTEAIIQEYKNQCTLLELEFDIPFTKFDINFEEAFLNFLSGALQTVKFT